MTSWTRAGRPQLCGRCGHTIERGEALFVIALAAVTQPKVRCGACAGPVPPDLPQLVVRAPMQIPQSWTRFTQKSVVPMFDVKAAQLGEREPGSDDE